MSTHIIEQKCHDIAERLSDMEAYKLAAETDGREDYDVWNYLNDIAPIVDVEFSRNGAGDYLGGRVWLACPNIFINTRINMIEGYYRSGHCFVPFTDAVGVDAALSDLYDQC